MSFKFALKATECKICRPGKETSCANIQLSAHVWAQEFSGAALSHPFTSVLPPDFEAPCTPCVFMGNFYASTIMQAQDPCSLPKFQLSLLGNIQDTQLFIFQRKEVFHLALCFQLPS